MSDDYRGISKGSKWACAIALVVGIPLFLTLLIMDALGDCAPDTSCRHGFFSMVVLPTLFVTGPMAFAVRHLINRASRGGSQ